jgi:isocitrate lyase
MLSHPSPNGSERFAAVRRDYSPADVERLAGSFRVRHSLAEAGAARLWHLLNTEPYVAALGALTATRRCSKSRPD